MTMTARPTAGPLVANYRKASRAAMRLNGRTRATTYAAARHENTCNLVLSALTDTPERRALAGDLVEEERLARRLMGVARRDRPELRARLAATRRRIADAVFAELIAQTEQEA